MGREIPSVLPPDLQEKHRAINRACSPPLWWTLISITVLLQILSFTAPHLSQPTKTRVVLTTVAFLSVLAIGVMWYVIRLGDRLSRESGYLCPHCGRPLYGSGAYLWRTGKCARCRHNILSDHETRQS